MCTVDKENPSNFLVDANAIYWAFNEGGVVVWGRHSTRDDVNTFGLICQLQYLYRDVQ